MLDSKIMKWSYFISTNCGLSSIDYE